MSRRRIVPALVAAALGVTVLAGCKSNVGTAARVDGTRITESDVNKYVNPNGIASDVAEQAAGSGSTISPRSSVVSFLIIEQVFRKSLVRHKVSITKGKLDALHDAAAASLLNLQGQPSVSSSALDRRLEQELSRIGIKRSFRPTIVRAKELELLLINDLKVKSQSDLLTAVKPVATKVSVTPRYGKWNAEQLGLSNEPALPSFVTAQHGSGGS